MPSVNSEDVRDLWPSAVHAMTDSPGRISPQTESKAKNAQRLFVRLPEGEKWAEESSGHDN